MYVVCSMYIVNKYLSRNQLNKNCIKIKVVHTAYIQLLKFSLSLFVILFLNRHTSLFNKMHHNKCETEFKKTNVCMYNEPKRTR